MWPIMHLPVGTLDRPIESFVALLCIVAGLTQLLGVGEQQSVAETLPPLLVKVWSLWLLIGGVIVLISEWRSDRRTERAGLLLLGATAFVYSMCAIAFLGVAAIYTVCITLAFSFAVCIRALVVGLLLQLEAALRDEDRHG
jgi:hypothetical protein